MGGQACVFYGAAQFSKDVDLVLLAAEENFARLRAALDELQAERIAVPRFDPELLARGHAVHFRCRHPLASGLRAMPCTAPLATIPIPAPAPIAPIIAKPAPINLPKILAASISISVILLQFE